jgi:hypothetical protein
MKFAALTSVIILLGAGSAFAADTDAGTAGRPTAVLSETDCVVAWHSFAGDEQSRFHQRQDGLTPAAAKAIVTNFQQADTDKDGIVSRDEFVEACRLGLINGGAADRNIAASVGY